MLHNLLSGGKQRNTQTVILFRLVLPQGMLLQSIGSIMGRARPFLYVCLPFYKLLTWKLKNAVTSKLVQTWLKTGVIINMSFWSQKVKVYDRRTWKTSRKRRISCARVYRYPAYAKQSGTYTGVPTLVCSGHCTDSRMHVGMSAHGVVTSLLRERLHMQLLHSCWAAAVVQPLHM